MRRGRITSQRSRAPLRLGVPALLVEIDETAARWEPGEKNTVERLRCIAARGWRPQDTPALERLVGDLQRWGLAATELVTPPVRVFLPMPCPRCGASRAYRHNSSGESVSSAALRVSEVGCQCLACRAFWPPSEFGWLARLLG